RPFLDHLIHLLRRHGITEVILAIQYLSDAFEQHYQDGASLGVSVIHVREEKPLGTAGAVKNVEKHLDDTFIVFNGDILTDLDLAGMIRFHRERASKLTIALTPVEDPTAYGLVELGGGQRIRRFLEKPKWEEVTTNLINAGTYIIEPEVLRHVPAQEFYMFERGLFPGLLQLDEPMFGYPSDCYWIDIGTPQKYLDVHRHVLAGRVSCHLPGEERDNGVRTGRGCYLDPAAAVQGPVIMGDRCRVEGDARISGPVVIGNDCVIGAGATVEDAVLWNGVTVAAGATVKQAVIASNSRIENGAIICGGAVVGCNCEIGPGNTLTNGIRIWPGVSLPPNAIGF
ncbi:MAG: NDP-sugar synthase, partial [Chloroflexi bacterium]|nr:NDP-sugar synthase [Chloroflexota bacterium]